jgi:hypothetical protein
MSYMEPPELRRFYNRDAPMDEEAEIAVNHAAGADRDAIPPSGHRAPEGIPGEFAG